MKETESHYVSSKKFKQTRQVYTKGEEQRSSSVRVGTKVTPSPDRKMIKLLTSE